jgi:hypothetical protein
MIQDSIISIVTKLNFKSYGWHTYNSTAHRQRQWWTWSAPDNTPVKSSSQPLCLIIGIGTILVATWHWTILRAVRCPLYRVDFFISNSIAQSPLTSRLAYKSVRPYICKVIKSLMVLSIGKVHSVLHMIFNNLDLSSFNSFQVSRLTSSHDASIWLCLTLKQMYHPIDHASEAISSSISLRMCSLISHKLMPSIAFKSPTLLHCNVSIYDPTWLWSTCALWYSMCQRLLTA